MPVFTSMATVTGNLLSSEKSKDFKDSLKNHELSVKIYDGKDFDVEEADLKRILDVLEKSNISDFMKTQIYLKIQRQKEAQKKK